ncbi:MAG: TonB-dependent receptor [Proteobacteria bacterium]|nr:TonB-dependent receptor [Pseudomonadota bacterium]MBU1056878.1 TonB-dependent receptor [Pseudomonadota bacterium]
MLQVMKNISTGLCVSLVTITAPPSYLWAADEEMLDLELSQLMQIQITSAGRKEQNLADVAAAVYVINQEAIHNSGATSIPEALRMVPGLQVLRMSSNKWAITSRGFNGVFSNKLLVQIDGRSVYTPSYSGVYWDVQNVVLEDVDRIEVIRGPGATLWGANAVNGIINIITKQSSDTQGGLISVAAGNHEDGIASFRYGAQLTEDTYGRLYVHRHDQDSYQHQADETDAHDDSQLSSGGFRLDGDFGLQNNWTVQGDLYHGDASQLIFPYWTANSPMPSTVDDQTESDGYNLLSRWQHKISETNTWTLQAYFDATERDEVYLGQTHHTFDLDFQHRLQWANLHDLVWGLGYRNISEEFANSYMVSINPAEKTSELFSGFIQDEISLIENTLKVTLGTKLEHNDYTGFEVQPSARLLWKATPNNTIWTSVSRAVRTPSRVEDSGKIVLEPLPIPPFPKISVYGNPELEAETVIAYEAGYRYSPSSVFSTDLSFFYNDYNDLADYRRIDMTSIMFTNGIEGHSYGLEISNQWRPLSWLTAELNYSYIELKMTSLDMSNQVFSISELVSEESSPKHQLSLRSSIDLSETVHFNILGRYVDQIQTSGQAAYSSGIIVDDYVALDVNIIWQPTKNLELMLVGQNLLDSNHLEFVHEYFIEATEVDRSVYAKLTWTF